MKCFVYEGGNKLAEGFGYGLAQFLDRSFAHLLCHVLFSLASLEDFVLIVE